MNKEIEKEFERMWEEDDHNYGDFKQFISQAIAQTREETIREVEERLPKMKMEAYEDAGKEFALIGFNDCISEVKTILNKLKK